MTRHYDVIVVGSGIAGLSFALKVASSGRRVALITKKTSADSNTNYAQGGICCVTGKDDDFESHVRDTLAAGDGLCDEAVTRAIVSAAPERIAELVAWGVEFSRKGDGSWDLGMEGGHTRRRILHAKDMTGKVIESALVASVAASANIEVFEHEVAIDVITRSRLPGSTLGPDDADNAVLGLYALDTRTGRVETFRSPVVLLATGGVGQVYRFTTNPDIATGDGIAMAYRAGATISNLEFVQFHPTALYTLDGERALISEAVRGEGAVLRDLSGRAFMADYHPQADLAPRDVVARAIDSEMKKSGAPHVWLDITGRPEEELSKRFPHIFETCLRRGVNMAHDMIPVVPAAHYLCGGVRTSLAGETGIPGLYACGEVACTGLHGANRLASNSLLEAVVVSHNASLSVGEYLASRTEPLDDVPDWVDGDVSDSDERVILSHNRDELRSTMWDYVGIVRTARRLRRAKTRIGTISREIDEYYWNFKVEPALLELRNLAQVADLIVECAMQRRESRGLHCLLDHPGHGETKYSTLVRRTFQPGAKGGNSL